MPRLKIILITIAACIFLFNSCSPKREICKYNIYYLPFGFVFKNFNFEEIDTLYLKEFTITESNIQLNKIDTIISDSFEHDGNIITQLFPYAHTDKYGTGSMKEGFEYELVIPALQQQVRAYDIKSGPTSHTFEVEGGCSPGAGQARFGLYTVSFESLYEVYITKGKSQFPADNIAVIVKP
jgi:hypothetical protein